MESSHLPPSPPTDSEAPGFKENPLRAEKRRKLQELRRAGIDPFPHEFTNKVNIDVLRQKYEPLLKAGEKSEASVYRVAGRLMALRSMGKASFFNIQDASGVLQAYIRPGELGTEAEIKAFSLVDLGDIVGLEGFIFRTQKGELSLHCQKFEILTKTLEPLPEKFHGLTDQESKYRYRHLDLISDLSSREVFQTRSKILRSIRNFMEERGFLEVETPVLQPIYGGASAHPFDTHHRALDMKLYLKISPELYLKRLVVGGFEKVFEIGKNFRNEGIDRTHNPEFTMMEWYEAYTDYIYQMKQFEDLVCRLVLEVRGSYKFSFQGREIDFTPPWRRMTVFESVHKYTGVDVDVATEKELFQVAREKAAAAKANFDFTEAQWNQLSRGEMIFELFELVVEPNLWEPTFIMDHPLEISPLTKIHRQDKRCVERFEPYAAGMEIGNAYTELNDPEDQAARLKAQDLKRRQGGDEEAHPMDADFLHAIDVGLPPTGGVGLGIERLVMLLTDRPSIRDIIFFPTMRTHENYEAHE